MEHHPMIQPETKRDQMMLEMFRQKMVDQLTAEAIDAIRPSIERAAIAVVREMNVHIQAEYAERGRELIVRLALGRLDFDGSRE
jgi:hypothetical protein